MSRDDFLVVFKDGTRAVIRNISNYAMDKENKFVKVTKNDQNSFFNFHQKNFNKIQKPCFDNIHLD